MNRFKKASIAGIAGLSLAGGSLAVATVSPLGIAGAQEDGTEETDRPQRGDRIATGLAEILAELVEEGVITDDQADAVSGRVDERIEERRAEFEARRAEHQAEREENMAAVADAAGVTVDELTDALRNGDSLADVAGDNVDAVIDLLVQEQTDRINDALENGRIDAERADELLADVEERVTDRVNGERPDRPFGHHDRRPGRDFAPGFDGPGFGGDDATDEPAAFDQGA